MDIRLASACRSLPGFPSSFAQQGSCRGVAMANEVLMSRNLGVYPGFTQRFLPHPVSSTRFLSLRGFCLESSNVAGSKRRARGPIMAAKKAAEGGLQEDSPYKVTVDLPRTKFNMKANSLTREPEVQMLWEQKEVLKKLQERNTVSELGRGWTGEMEASAGVGGVIPLVFGAMNLRSSSCLSSRQCIIGRSSPFVRFGRFASSGTRISVQRRGYGRLKNLRIFVKVGEETGNTQDSAGTTEDPKVMKGKGFGSPKQIVEGKKSSSSAPSSSIRRTPPQKPLIAAQVDEETKQFETAIVASLTFLFSLIILEGIALAASGFLPEDWDDFLLKVIYPIFTPTVGVFLAGAAGYGVWKFFGEGEAKGPTGK